MTREVLDFKRRSSAAVVATVVAIVTIEVLIEIRKNLLPPAIAAVLAELHHVAKHLLLALFLLITSLTIVDHTLQRARIPVTIIQIAAGLLPIATCAASLLVVA